VILRLDDRIPHSVKLNFFFYFGRIQALANLNEDELPDVAIQMTLTSGSANTTWVIAKHMCTVSFRRIIMIKWPPFSLFILFYDYTLKNMADSGT
jgi:hypothetical protein